MKISRMYIEDFGIFQNMLVENIKPGVVVVGGLNGAGKTTLLQFLKHYGYGFKKGNNLPQAKAQYSSTVNCELESGERCLIKTEGFGKPKVSFNDNDFDIEASNIYSIDQYTYNQLFTISLDELSRMEKGDRKLQTVLLGAGFKEIVNIPKYMNEFTKESDKIGGKFGKIDTKMLKNYYNLIEEGNSIKAISKSNCDKYNQAQNELNNAENELVIEKNENNSLSNKIIYLDILKNLYESCARKKELDLIFDENTKEFYNNYNGLNSSRIIELKNEYSSITEEYERAVTEFRCEINNDLKVKDKILNSKDLIQAYYSNISGLKERVKKFFDLEVECDREKDEINVLMYSVNEAWRGNFELIFKIDCDTLAIDKLNKIIENYNKISDSIKINEREIEEIKINLKVLQYNESDESEDDIDKNKRYLLGGISFGLSLLISSTTYGALVYFKIKNPLILSVSMFVIMLILLMVIFLANKLLFRSQIEDLNEDKNFDELQGLQLILSQKNKSLEVLKQNFTYVNEELNEYKIKLMLDEEISPDGVREYFKSVQELKRRMHALYFKNRNNTEVKAQVLDELNSIRNLLQVIECKDIENLIIRQDNVDLKDYSHRIFSAIETSFKGIDITENLYIAEQNKAIIEERIVEECDIFRKSEVKNKNLVSSSSKDTNSKIVDIGSKNLFIEIQKSIENALKHERLKQLIEELGEVERKIILNLNTTHIKESIQSYFKSKDDNILRLFMKGYELFSSMQEVSSEYTLSVSLKSKTEIKIDEIKGKIQTLKDTIETLMVDENLKIGQLKIDEGREGLKRLSEKYAVYNLANYMLQKVYDNFLNNSKDSLLKNASSYMNKITEGRVSEILPPKDIREMDFSSVDKDGEIKNSAEVLSRGTKEQLFLSIRISRLKEINAKLPIIIDDSMVNFDSMTLRNSIKIISELSKENQVFVLTCHPHMIRLLKNECEDAQYFKMENGVMSETEAPELLEYLDYE